MKEKNKSWESTIKDKSISQRLKSPKLLIGFVDKKDINMVMQSIIEKIAMVQKILRL